MGKKSKTNKPTKATKEAEPKATKKEGYGVAYLAEQLGLEPFTIRQKLRKAKVEKGGRSYTWATKKEADEVLKAIKSVKVKNEK